MNKEEEKIWVSGYIKGYMTGLEHIQKYCEDMIESKRKEFKMP